MSDCDLVNESSPKGCATTDLVERDDLTSKIAANALTEHLIDMIDISIKDEGC